MLCVQAEKQMELVKELIHGGRSLRSDYKLANHIKADFYYICTSPEIGSVITNWSQDFCTLARANHLHLLGVEGAKKGYCVRVISDQISLFIDLTDIIDIPSELLRLTKEKERLELSIDTYVKKVNVPNYDTKVPESVREVNAEKISSFELELAATMKALISFEQMRV
jgi:valyl-tRNA synthetase